MQLEDNFLVSLPTLTGGAFSESVIYIKSHTGDGASGWIVNKQLDDKIAQRLRRGMGLTKDLPLYYGGPIDVNNACVIHSDDLVLPNSKRLNSELYCTADKSIINVMNIGQFPEYWRVIVGKSSWAPGQIESEILGSRTNGVSSWTNVTYSKKLMWNTLPSNQWQTAIELGAEQMTSSILEIKI